MKVQKTLLFRKNWKGWIFFGENRRNRKCDVVPSSSLEQGAARSNELAVRFHKFVKRRSHNITNLGGKHYLQVNPNEFREATLYIDKFRLRKKQANKHRLEIKFAVLRPQTFLDDLRILWLPAWVRKVPFWFHIITKQLSFMNSKTVCHWFITNTTNDV